MHKSKLGGFTIDCQTNDLNAAAQFWGAALGMEKKLLAPEEGGEKYMPLLNSEGVQVEVQAVTHPSHVHLDIATDNLEEEKKRLEKLGAKYIAHVKTWIVMEAPTGQRFCIVDRKNSENFEERAHTWN
jgi:predicted enzyme related to lactoylglutathione lyase